MFVQGKPKQPVNEPLKAGGWPRAKNKLKKTGLWFQVFPPLSMASHSEASVSPHRITADTARLIY